MKRRPKKNASRKPKRLRKQVLRKAGRVENQSSQLT